MKRLLDTQVMLWWLLGDARLRQDTRERMAHTACLVSVASVWEVAIEPSLSGYATLTRPDRPRRYRHGP